MRTENALKNAEALGVLLRDMSPREVKEFTAALIGLIADRCTVLQWRDLLRDALLILRERLQLYTSKTGGAS